MSYDRTWVRLSNNDLSRSKSHNTKVKCWFCNNQAIDMRTVYYDRPDVDKLESKSIYACEEHLEILRNLIIEDVRRLNGIKKNDRLNNL